MIKFMSLQLLGLSHRFLGKIKNAVYRLEISSLVPEIFKLEKCVKYANERTDDVNHSSQYNIKYINRPISLTLQQRPLRPSRLIVLQPTHLQPNKNWFPRQLTLFQSPQPDFMVFGDFKFKKHLTRPHTRPNIFICLLDHELYVAPFANFRIECQRRPAKPLMSGRSGTQYVAMVTKLVCPYRGTHLVESYCKESSISDANWLRYLCSS